MAHITFIFSLSFFPILILDFATEMKGAPGAVGRYLPAPISESETGPGRKAVLLSIHHSRTSSG